MYLKEKSKKKKNTRKQNQSKIELTKREIKGLLKIFNRINIYHIENENALWTQMISEFDIKQTNKLLNAKKMLIDFSFRMEKKLLKIMRMTNNETNSSAKVELLITGLFYLELLLYNEKKDYNWEKLNFNKTTLKEYWEAKTFITENFQNIKFNIEKELYHLFQKIAKKKNVCKLMIQVIF